MTKPVITVLQLDTDFPRIPGDVACPETYCVPIQTIKIPSASVSHVVSAHPEKINIALFEEAVNSANGQCIVSSCGFLSYWQNHLQSLTSTPVICSSLSALHALQKTFKANEILTVTFDANSLVDKHFSGDVTDIVGLPEDMHLRQVITHNLSSIDTVETQQALTQVITQALLPRHKHLLFECTNLPPYKLAVQQQTGLDVSDILTCIEARLSGSVNTAFIG